MKLLLYIKMKSDNHVILEINFLEITEMPISYLLISALFCSEENMSATLQNWVFLEAGNNFK